MFMSNKKIKKDNVKLGEGTYGQVYVGKLTAKGSSNERYAIKKIKFHSKREGIPPNAIREICLLRAFDHEHIIKLVDVIFSPKDKVYLVFELAKEDLRKFLDTNKEIMTIYKITEILRQLMKAIYYCHNNFIMHRDLKPQNILIMPNGTIKIADFGLSRIYCLSTRSMTHEIVTLWYRAPEILLGLNEYNFGVDIWSLGCIFAELFTHRPLFKGSSEIDQLFKIFRVKGTPTEDSWPQLTLLKHYNALFPKWEATDNMHMLTNITSEGVELINSMLTMDPQRRISIKDAINHTFMMDK